MLRIVQKRWPLWIRFTITGGVVLAAYLLQIPLELEIPGEPFLLFFLVVIGVTLAFGASAGFVAVAMTTLLSVSFFEPFGTFFTLHYAADLGKIEVYALLASGCVFAFARIADALSTAIHETRALKRSGEKGVASFLGAGARGCQ